jgi:uncharacterized membrane protein
LLSTFHSPLSTFYFLLSTTIYRPAQEIYSYWRQFENLPRFMCHLGEVQDLGCNRSRWTAKGPLGSTVSWEAEIVRDVPPELISWRTLARADMVSAGSVRFKPAASVLAMKVLGLMVSLNLDG